MEKKARIPLLKREVVYASAYMHECGHTLAIFNGNTPGVMIRAVGIPGSGITGSGGRIKVS